MTPYAQLLGPALDRLPGPCRAIHAGFGRFRGEITVTAAANPLVRGMIRMAGLPAATVAAPLAFRTEPTPRGARWIRQIGDHAMVSLLRAMPDGTLAERLGPVTIAARLVPEDRGLRLVPAWVHALTLPLPRPLWPGIEAREWADDRLYRFEVALSLPLGGPRLIAYSGWLDPVAV